MSLPHILLGLLAEPKSGYEIKKRFDESLRHFWFVELSQLYPSLKKLVVDGLATVEESPSNKGPDKKLYRRTDAGRETLLTWLVDEPVKTPTKIPHLAKIFFMGELEQADDAIAFFRELKNRYSCTRQTLEAIEEQWDAQDPYYPDALPDDQFYVHLTLEAGIDIQKTYEAWCDRSIQRIEARK